MTDSNWCMDEILEVIAERPSFNFRPDNLALEETDTELSDIEDDFAEIPPVYNYLLKLI